MTKSYLSLDINPANDKGLFLDQNTKMEWILILFLNIKAASASPLEKGYLEHQNEVNLYNQDRENSLAEYKREKALQNKQYEKDFEAYRRHEHNTENQNAYLEWLKAWQKDQIKYDKIQDEYSKRNKSAPYSPKWDYKELDLNVTSERVPWDKRNLLNEKKTKDSTSAKSYPKTPNYPSDPDEDFAAPPPDYFDPGINSDAGGDIPPPPPIFDPSFSSPIESNDGILLDR